MPFPLPQSGHRKAIQTRADKSKTSSETLQSILVEVFRFPMMRIA
jgi:hypothetical protein